MAAYLLDNVAVDWMKTAAVSYVVTMKQLVVNTLTELYPGSLSTRRSSAGALTPEDMMVLLTAVSSLCGFVLSLGSIYCLCKLIYWICCHRPTDARSRRLLRLNGGARDRGSAVEVGRWFNQAWNDLTAARNDFEGDHPAPEWVCFKCQQAIEKGLKALLLSTKGDRPRPPIVTHDICELAAFVDDARLVAMATQLQGIVGMSSRMRYPDLLPSPKTPRDVYSLEMALNAFNIAEEALDIIRQAIQVPLDYDYD